MEQENLGTTLPVLYDYWRSSASYRLRIALALKGIAYHRHAVDLLRGDHRAPEHLARNPQGLVPALAIDGLMLTQSLAILEYLEETRPDVPLLPKDPVLRARVRAVALAIAADLHPVSNLRVLERVEAIGGKDARAAWNVETIRAGLAAVERMLDADGPFAFGDRPTLADCVIVPQLYNARRWGVGLDEWPKLSRVDLHSATHPAFLDAAPVAPD